MGNAHTRAVFPKVDNPDTKLGNPSRGRGPVARSGGTGPSVSRVHPVDDTVYLEVLGCSEQWPSSIRWVCYIGILNMLVTQASSG